VECLAAGSGVLVRPVLIGHQLQLQICDFEAFLDLRTPHVLIELQIQIWESNESKAVGGGHAL
jgi:hypothetical protein